MSDISTVSSDSAMPLTSSLAGGSNDLGKDEFLMLMVEQLKNQDPMDPQDATEFTAQLAQYSSLEQLINANTNLEGMASTSGEVQRMSALSMIGNEVVTSASEFKFNGSAMKLGYDLEGAADQGSLYIRNATGSTVATISIPDLSAGQHFIEWDGMDENGQPLPDGSYTLGVAAYNGDDAVVASSLICGEVVGVDLIDGGDMLVTTAGDFRFVDVESVRGGI